MARASGTQKARGKPAGGVELVERLNSMIDELIKENRRLKREVDRLTARSTAAATGSLERTLRSIQGRVERALGPAKKKKTVKRRTRK